MPEWSQFVKRYALEPDDLPIAHGANIVVIESIDSEEYIDPTTRMPTTRHRLILAGWEHPLRLNNTRIKVLQQMFGPRVEDAIGKKIVLTVAATQSYGEVKPCINIHPFAPDQNAAPVSVPPHLGTRSQIRLQAARAAGVSFGREQNALPPSSSRDVKPTGKPLGDEAAAELCLLLRERGRDWAWLADHCRRHAMAALVDADMPGACDAALRAPAWSLLKDLPITRAIPAREDEKAKLLASWREPDAAAGKGPTFVPDERDMREEDIPF